MHLLNEVEATAGDIEEFLFARLTSARQQLFTEGRGFDRSRHFFDLTGGPHRRLRAIHIAGSAGKGSTATYLATFLARHDFTVGLHVSPHIADVRERLTTNGEMPTWDWCADVINARILPAIRTCINEGFGIPTFFEVTNFLAFHHFADAAVDYAVVEVGLGGRWDSTNHLRRSDKLAILTNVQLEHTKTLGQTTAEIAHDKAHVVTNEGVLLTGDLDHAALAEAVRVVADHGATLVPVRSDQLDVRMLGASTAANASMARRSAQLLSERDGWQIDRSLVNQLPPVPGRLEPVPGLETVAFLDGAHSPGKFDALFDNPRLKGQAIVLVLAVDVEKDLPSIANSIPSNVSTVILTEYRVTGGDYVLRESWPADSAATILREREHHRRADPSQREQRSRVGGRHCH